MTTTAGVGSPAAAILELASRIPPLVTIATRSGGRSASTCTAPGCATTPTVSVDSDSTMNTRSSSTRSGGMSGSSIRITCGTGTPWMCGSTSGHGLSIISASLRQLRCTLPDESTRVPSRSNRIASTSQVVIRSP